MTVLECMAHLLLVEVATKCFGLMRENNLFRCKTQVFVVSNVSYFHIIPGVFKFPPQILCATG